MADHSDCGGSGPPHRAYFTAQGETGRLTSPSGTVTLGPGLSSTPAQTIQIVMPPGGVNRGQGSELRISVSSGQGKGTPGTIILGSLGGSHGTSVTFSTLPRRVAPTQGDVIVTGGQEGRRVRRMHSSDVTTPLVGRVTFSTPQIEENVYSPSACDSSGVETNRVMLFAPVNDDNVYGTRVMSPPAQDGKQVFVHKIHLVPTLSSGQRAVVTGGSESVSPVSSGVPVSAPVGVAGPVHESVCHVPKSHSTWTGVNDGSVDTATRFYVVSSTDTKTQADPQQQAWRDTNRLRQFDDTIASNMRRFMSRESHGDGVGYDTPPVTPPGSQKLPAVRKLPVFTITHRRKASADQSSDVCPETPLTPDDKRDLFRKFKFRFGSIGEFAGSSGGGSGGSRQTRSSTPEVFYFQDFDDLASRIRVLWSNRQEKPTRGETNLSAVSGHRGEPRGGCDRPKSFLRDEMDEFDRVFSELLFSPQSRTSASLSQNSRWASFDRVVEEFENEAADLRVNSSCVSSAHTVTQTRHSGSFSTEHTPTTYNSRQHSGSPSFKHSAKDTSFLSSPFSARLPHDRHSSGGEDVANESNSDASSYSQFSHLCDRSDKLFADLLDDLDNLGGDSASVRRRRRARDLFSDWLFGNASISRQQGPLLLGERPMLRRNRAGVDRKQYLSKRRSADFSDTSSRPGFYTRWRRPRSTEFYNEDDADSGYHTGNSTLQSVAAAARGAGVNDAALSREELRCCIQAFNDNHHGLIMTLDPQLETFQGFIRVHLNLIRPINMSVSGRPPSFYEVLTHEGEAREKEEEEKEHITSFYLPKNTTKVVHICSETTTEQVIRALLAKYKITDNPRKFALYEKVEENGKVRMQRLVDDKCPLPQCLSWTAAGLDTHMFVLQENDTGEIIWEAFSLPELENFLKILDREEAEYAEQVKAKYHLLKLQMTQRLKQLNKECPTDDKRQPVFV